MTFVTYKCPSCKGCAHPSSGSQISENVVICGRCVRSFVTWIKAHQERRYRVGPKGKGARYIPFPY